MGALQRAMQFIMQCSLCYGGASPLSAITIPKVWQPGRGTPTLKPGWSRKRVSLAPCENDSQRSLRPALDPCSLFCTATTRREECLDFLHARN
jgi:hypothetical protein